MDHSERAQSLGLGRIETYLIVDGYAFELPEKWGEGVVTLVCADENGKQHVVKLDFAIFAEDERKYRR